MSVYLEAKPRYEGCSYCPPKAAVCCCRYCRKCERVWLAGTPSDYDLRDTPGGMQAETCGECKEAL